MVKHTAAKLALKDTQTVKAAVMQAAIAADWTNNAGYKFSDRSLHIKNGSQHQIL